MEIKEQILKALGLSQETEVTLEYQAKLEDGTTIVSSADALEAGVDVSVLTEDGTTIPLPEGEYKIEDGVSFKVEEEGKVAEIMEEEEEDPEEEEAGKEDEDYKDEDDVKMEEEIIEEVEEPSEVTEARHPKKIKTTEEIEFNKEELISEVSNVVSELLSEFKTELSELSAEMETLKGYKETLEEETIDLQKQVVELSAKPAAEPITTNKFSKTNKIKSNKAYKDMSAKERFMYNLNNN
ncbi:MAG: hypothetical protein Unbinned4264contig1000_34 [Prokaryotic dsDNA virus sp.]|nr:MAG: hypothetical protein Unbinned4264contig1000_34 [Prokaryotic dsDNA virus sp.]|tara:strand:+ start:6349 stop:7065 length:717 start_codon:yes stop_codon:yes gene_type:complete